MRETGIQKECMRVCPCAEVYKKEEDRVNGGVRACVRACLPACLPACLRACLPACLPACACDGLFAFSCRVASVLQ